LVIVVVFFHGITASTATISVRMRPLQNRQGNPLIGVAPHGKKMSPSVLFFTISLYVPLLLGPEDLL
jgi:hypothetical protein